MGAIYIDPCPTEPGFYSRLFLVPKKGGSMRPVIDLSYLNRFIQNSHFQMESILCLKTIIKKGDFMTSIDLKDAYLSVQVHKSSQRYLRFQWEGKCYTFRGLPFGLNTAPRVFTKLTKPVVSFLRKRGVRMIAYLDDFLLLGSTKTESNTNTSMAVQLLQSLGFTVNREKSHLEPCQQITFLGFIINSETLTLSLPMEKVNKIIHKCQNTLAQPTVTAQEIASLLGSLESSRLAIHQAPLHFRHLQIQLINHLRNNAHDYETKLSLNHHAREEIRWWITNIAKVNGSPINPPAPDLVITSDASKMGWGAFCKGSATNGRWSNHEKNFHINFLELKAAFLALKAFMKYQHHKTVCLRMDNSTAVAHINNKGGTRSSLLVSLTLEIWEWCLQREILISAQHLPGKDNCIADKESREFHDSSEWKINPRVIHPFLKECNIDLFASRLTTQLQQFVSWRPDPEAFHTDSMTLDWGPLKGYAFPPFALIPAVLRKVTTDKADLTLIAPIWQAQTWWPMLLRLLTKNPVMLPNTRHMLIDPASTERVHPLFPRLHLAVFHISGKIYKQKAFLRTLPKYYCQPLDPPHIRRTSPHGGIGAAGVINQRLILFQQP